MEVKTIFKVIIESDILKIKKHAIIFDCMSFEEVINQLMINELGIKYILNTKKNISIKETTMKISDIKLPGLRIYNILKEKGNIIGKITVYKYELEGMNPLLLID